jgi:PIN domain nuclease of toxin-antitoxin system
VRLLLDTHIWIWAATSPEKLAPRVQRELQRTRNELYLSPVSIWEARHLERRRKLRTKLDFSTWLKQVLSQMPLRDAACNFAVATSAAQIELPQSDPGDIFLAATALTFELTLVTADAHLIECSWLKSLAND